MRRPLVARRRVRRPRRGALPSMAQQYPTRPIEFVIPFATGGPTDTAIRVIQPQLAANLGVPVVLVNKAGAGGALGMDTVAKAKPDGYTLAATMRSTVTILPATQPDVTYKLSDFAVIGSYAFDSVRGAREERGARSGPWRSSSTTRRRTRAR